MSSGKNEQRTIIADDIVVGVAVTPEEINAIYRLRYHVYCFELKSFKPEDLPDGREKDKYDDYATHICAKHKGVIIGSLRLVKDNPHGFVMEQAFTLPPYIDRNKTVEQSRSIVRSDYRGLSIYTRMLEAAYVWQRAHGFPIVVGVANLDKIDAILIARGWRHIGDTKEYRGIQGRPMMFDVSTHKQ